MYNVAQGHFQQFDKGQIPYHTVPWQASYKGFTST